MQKQFLVLQPPIVNHYSLLVDDINATATFGHTTDRDKCEYNRQVIEAMGLDLDFMIQVQTALSDKGVTGVIPVGRYIGIIEASKDETQQEMFFIDHLARANFREQNKVSLAGYFSENIVNQFEKIHALLKAEFTEQDDLVELVLMED